MFTADIMIDSIQTAKKQFVTTFVKHEEIAKHLNEFVDAQTAYTKQAVKVSKDTGAKIAEEVVKASRELSKGEALKKMADKASQDFYSSFWKEAFKFYQTPAKA